MYRILLVDDEILVRDAIRENIDWEGMDCELVGDCENGKQAAEFVSNHPVDIVLTDICMPYMDGMELSHFLHDNYPDIVIVIFSGFGEFEYAKKAIQYNVSEYMLKPITAMELRGVIEKMKAKVDLHKSEQKKLETLTKTSENYRKNAQVIRSRAIESLVKCTQDVQESLNRLQEMGITLDAKSYRVAVFDMDLYSDLYQIDVEKSQESALMAFVLFNVADEIVTRENAGIAFQEGSSCVCILFMGDHTREFGEKVRTICGEIQKQLQEVIGLDVSAGIGSWERSLKHLLLSYNLARKALEYRYLLGKRLLIDMEEENTDVKVSLEGIIRHMSNAIRIGNEEDMERDLEKMEQAVKDAKVDKSRACMYLQQIIRAISSCQESVTEGGQTKSLHREELLHQVTEQKSFQAAAELVKGYARAVFGQFSQLNSSSGQRQAVLAMDYIQKNYMDSDLSLNSICSYLNISTSYFSTIFKEVTGETFIEALTRIRMNKARELLENTTLKNYEIAEKVGFSDPHYFGISFKKMTGKTPTEYAREKRR